MRISTLLACIDSALTTFLLLTLVAAGVGFFVIGGPITPYESEQIGTAFANIADAARGSITNLLN